MMQRDDTLAKPEYEDLLERCRTAKTRQQQEERFQDLISFLQDLREHEKDNARIIAEETVVRAILTEFPYNQLSKTLDRVLDVCGIGTTIGTCSSLLKEIIAAAKSNSSKSKQPLNTTSNESNVDKLSSDIVQWSSSLPSRSVVEACWKTIQRMLLQMKSPRQGKESTMMDPVPPENDTDDNDVNDDAVQGNKQLVIRMADQVEMQRFVSSIVLLLPHTLANACNTVQLQVPLAMTSSYFYPGVLFVACRQIIPHQHDRKNSSHRQFAINLIRTLLRSRRSEYVAQGTFQWLDSLLSTHPPSLSCSPIQFVNQFLIDMDLTSYDLASLIIALLKQWDSSDAPSTHEEKNAVLEMCQSLFQQSSLEHQEAIIERLVFSKYACTSIQRTPYQWSRTVGEIVLPINQLATPSTTSSFLTHLASIAERWSQWTFVQEVEGRQQHHVSLVLFYGIRILASPPDDTTSLPSLQDTSSQNLNIAIMEGVSHRLGSTITTLRQDGMRIATELAKGLGQEIHFDELKPIENDNIHDKKVDDKNIGAKITDSKRGKENVSDTAMSSTSNTRRSLSFDPDAVYDSEDEQSADDTSVEWDDELIPYDLNDDEEDLVETPKPLHLVEALELLRTSENEDHAYTRHEAALNALPELVRSRPDNLPDVAVSLALELLRMEDKFSLNDFDLKRQRAIVALLVEEPVQVGSAYIGQLFADGGLGDRLSTLGALQGAAMELAGFRSRDPPQENRTKALMNSSPQSEEHFNALSLHRGSQVLAKTRIKRSRPSQRIVKNDFGPIAPMWFYSLVSEFLKHKEEESIWSGSTGSIFLSHLFGCLATIVEYSGIQASQVLATDLLSLVWDFRTADVAEVRLSVLVSVATSVAMLPDDAIVPLLLQENYSLPRAITEMSGNDPDSECRSLSRVISKSIYDVIQKV